MQNKKEVLIQDMSHAAYLLSLGHEIVDITREGSVIRWHFDNTDGVVDQIVRKFINGDAQGDCRKFSDALKTLKQTLRTP